MKVPKFQWLDDEQSIQDRMLEGVEKRLRDLYDQLHTLEDGLPLLRFLHENANTLMTIEDIAYFLKRPYAALEASLYSMVDLGLTRSVDAAGVVFFGLTRDRERLQLVRDLFAWQDHWRARSTLMERVLEGKAHPLFKRSIRSDARV